MDTNVWLELLNKSNKKTATINKTTEELNELKANSVNATRVDSQFIPKDMTNYFERPVLGKILILPKKSAQLFEYDKPWACISVSDSYAYFDADLKNPHHVLRLRFDDTEFDVDNPTNHPISLEQVKQIEEFAADVWNKVDLMMIHCNAGWSRSPAIGRMLSLKYQPEFEKYFDLLYSPNVLVVKRFNEARK